jgi:hypothetical protein
MIDLLSEQGLRPALFCFCPSRAEKWRKGASQMSRTIALLVVGTPLCLGLPAWAQDYPKAELFGGLSIATVGDEDQREHGFGWQASVAGNFHPNVGIVADFGGQYKTLQDFGDDVSLRAHEFLFGPRLTARGESTSLFGHWLIGGASVRAGLGSASASDTLLMMGIGAGADLEFGDRAALRVIQFDWLPVRFEDEWFGKAFRVGAGLVFKAGQ